MKNRTSVHWFLVGSAAGVLLSFGSFLLYVGQDTAAYGAGIAIALVLGLGAATN
jgi:hypothetical protein